MFTYSRRVTALIAAAVMFGVFSTTTLPVLSGSGQAEAAAKKKKKKKVIRTRQS